MSMSNCQSQLDSMQQTTCSLRLPDEKRGGGREGHEDKGEEDVGKGMRGGVMRGGWVVESKTNVILAVIKKKQRLLLGEARLAACSREWVQHCGMTLLLDLFCCSRQIQRHSVCTGKRSEEKKVDCMGKQVPADTVVRFYLSKSRIWAVETKDEEKKSVVASSDSDRQQISLI